MSTFSDHSQHRHGAVLVKKNRIISKGFNKVKTHTCSTHCYKNIHAELDAILKARRQDVNGCTLYLYRQDKNGIKSNSRPCSWCLILLKQYGIKKVYYTFEGSYKEEII